jgi:hypothetical protein
VTFSDAVYGCLNDPLAIVIPHLDHSHPEQRLIIIGQTAEAFLVVLALHRMTMLAKAGWRIVKHNVLYVLSNLDAPSPLWLGCLPVYDHHTQTRAGAYRR